MPEFRRDPLSDHWVIIAPDRAQRPEQFAGEGPRVPHRCPFCRGHEGDTPETVVAYREDGTAATGGDWQVRVIPNKYPAVERQATAAETGGPFFELRGGFGVHEVILEAPDHVTSLSDLTDRQVGLILFAYRERLRELSVDRRLAYAQIFKNSGAAAGASLEHAHSQLIATPVVPTQVQRELGQALLYYQRHQQCVFCTMLAAELAVGARVVAGTEHFVAFCPFASQFPYEVWILPRVHESHFEAGQVERLGELAGLLRAVIGRSEIALDRPAFNYLIHTAPFDRPALEHYHWHLEFSPRLVKTAGFEWGAGDYINIVTPEEAAGVLRSHGS